MLKASEPCQDSRDAMRDLCAQFEDQDDCLEKSERYVVNGQKVWISRIRHSGLMILLARTTPLDQVKKKSGGMSIFISTSRRAIPAIP